MEADLQHAVDGDVDDDEVLAHRGAAGEQLAAGVEDERVAVEDELVLAADLVHVRDRDVVVGGARGQHALALAGLAGVEGRGVDVDDDRGAGERGVAGGAVGVPDVLADGGGDRDAADDEARRPRARLEVALLVEDAVVWEALLAVAGDDAPAVDEGGAVVEHAVELEAADDERGQPLRVARERLEGGDGLVDERRAQQQVLGRVAADRELGEGDEVGVALGGAARGVEDQRAVAREVADGAVDLGERDPQSSHRPPLSRSSSPVLALGARPRSVGTRR